MKTRIVMRLQMVLLAASLSACATTPGNLLATPGVNLSNIQVVGLGFKKQTFLLSFDVANPNPFPLPVRSIDYGIELDGQRFASGETVCDFTVPAEGDTSFAISVDLNLLQTAPRLLSLIRDGARGEIPYELDGRFGVDVPFSPTVKYRNNGTIRFSADAL